MLRRRWEYPVSGRPQGRGREDCEDDREVRRRQGRQRHDQRHLQDERVLQRQLPARDARAVGDRRRRAVVHLVDHAPERVSLATEHRDRCASEPEVERRRRVGVPTCP